MSVFDVWASGTLNGISAPINAVTVDALWAWSQAEGGIDHNNPLNTTWNMPGATPWNTLSNGVHVWIYQTIEDGIAATVLTLEQPGFYPAILSMLRNSVPRSQWSPDAQVELNLWGTGTGWLNTYYGAAPSDAVGGTDLTSAESTTLTAAQQAAQYGVQTNADGTQTPTPFALGIKKRFDEQEASVSALTAKVDALAAIAQRIESALKGA